MKNSKLLLYLQNMLPAVSIIVFAVLMRLLPHPANVAPIAGLALFGGIYLDKRYALLIPLLAMLISDMVLGFHSTVLFVYGSFLLTGGIGLVIRKYKGVGSILAGSLFSSLLFFVITNFGVWLVGTLYPHTFSGLLTSYTFGLPFFRNTLLGDLFYTGLFCTSYEVMYWMVVTKKRAYGHA